MKSFWQNVAATIVAASVIGTCAVLFKINADIATLKSEMQSVKVSLGIVSK